MELCKTILIVEDHDNIRETLAEALRDEGYIVETAKNGKVGLKKLEALPVPSLVLLDLMMPVMTGWEFLDIQKKSPSLSAHSVLVISAVSGTAGLYDHAPLDLSRTVGLVSKPIVLDPLFKRVRELCRLGDYTAQPWQASGA